MVSERVYELCRPVLDDDKIDEEEKADALEELLSAEPTKLKGKALEEAVLGVLWQWKSNSSDASSPPPARGAAPIRSRSPAPWIQRAATPTTNSTRSGTSSPRFSSATPSVPPGFAPQPPALARTKSSTVGSPFSSPKPSPRLPVATPVIPHSPRLSAYQFSDYTPSTENYGDYGSDNVDWLVNDDTSSNASFGASSEFMQPYNDMSPYDMLRSILQDSRSDEELEQILEANGWDLSQTVSSIMDSQGGDAAGMAAAMQQQQQEEQTRTYLIGKNMAPGSRPATPLGQQKSPTVCRYWLASGHCARADCRFAHEVQNHLCKYWLAGSCMAGDTCLFSHDPTLLMQQLSLATDGTSTPQQFAPNFQLQDYDSFPALQPTTSNPFEDSQSVDATSLNSALRQQQQAAMAQAPPGLFPNFVPTGPRLGGSKPNSRPGSRHTSRAPTPSGSQVNFQDDEAFPTLGSAAAKPIGKRHHGKRGGHGHHNHSTAPVQQPSSLADVVRMSPSPSPASSNIRDAMRRGLKNNKSFTSTRENSSAAMSIPAPKDIPWLETGDRVNTAYLKARQEAFKHGGLRNKFLQSAAQAWNRNDARGAKALSLRGQNENALMREKHREAAKVLYAERNKSQGTGKEVYVDLHGLHPEEAVGYLETCLKEQSQKKIPGGGDGSRKVVYAICGTGHHSKNGKDKVGKAVRNFLNESRFLFREFSVPGDRNNVGGILGIDSASGEFGIIRGTGDGDSGVGFEGEGTTGKVLLVKEDPRKAAATVAGGRDED